MIRKAWGPCVCLLRVLHPTLTSRISFKAVGKVPWKIQEMPGVYSADKTVKLWNGKSDQ